MATTYFEAMSAMQQRGFDAMRSTQSTQFEMLRLTTELTTSVVSPNFRMIAFTFGLLEQQIAYAKRVNEALMPTSERVAAVESTGVAEPTSVGEPTGVEEPLVVGETLGVGQPSVPWAQAHVPAEPKASTEESPLTESAAEAPIAVLPVVREDFPIDGATAPTSFSEPRKIPANSNNRSRPKRGPNSR